MITDEGIKKGSKLKGAKGLVTVSEVVECESGSEAIVRIEGGESIFIVGSCLLFAEVNSSNLIEFGFKGNVSHGAIYYKCKDYSLSYHFDRGEFFFIKQTTKLIFKRKYIHEMQNMIEELLK